jgi:hypothetical protein
MELWVPAANHRLQHALTDNQQGTDGNNRGWEEKQNCFSLMDAFCLEVTSPLSEKKLRLPGNSLNPYYVLALERKEWVQSTLIVFVVVSIRALSILMVQSGSFSLSLSLGANGKKVPKTRRDIFLSCPPELTFCKLPINKRTYTNKTERIQHPFEYN